MFEMRCLPYRYRNCTKSTYYHFDSKLNFSSFDDDDDDVDGDDLFSRRVLCLHASLCALFFVCQSIYMYATRVNNHLSNQLFGKQ